jgi:hypothetical protein
MSKIDDNTNVVEQIMEQSKESERITWTVFLRKSRWSFKHKKNWINLKAKNLDFSTFS